MNNATYCRAYKAGIKERCLAIFDTRCNRCGFTDPRALQIDHRKGGAVNNNHGNTLYGRGSTGLYLKILKGTVPFEDYQCLCANCNWIKRYENPSESTRRKT
jgi:hypothetical protein